MKNKEYRSLIKMIEYINKSLTYTAGMSFQQFEKDNKTIDATVFNLSQIGELVANISEETRKKYKNIEWRMIKGLRNRIVHDYEGINIKNIWYIILNDIPELKKSLQCIVDDNKEE